MSERERTGRSKKRLGQLEKNWKRKSVEKRKWGKERGGREKKLCVLEGEKIVIKTEVGRVGRDNAYMGRDRKSAWERTGERKKVVIIGRGE